MDLPHLFSAILLVGTVVINTILAFVVFKNNPKSTTNRLYALLSTIISVWLVANYISLHPAFLTTSLFWIRVTIFIATPMTMMFFLLAHTLPNARLQLSQRKLSAVLLTTLAVMIINISPYAFTAVELTDGTPRPTAGPGIIPFATLVTVFNVMVFYVLFKKLREATGIKMVQLRLVMLGMTIMIGLLIATVLIPAAFFGANFFVTFIPIYTLLFLGFVAYAIIRYRLMDIRALILRVLGFTVLSGSFFALYGLLIYRITSYFSRFGVSPLQHSILVIVAVALAMPAFHYFRLGLRKLTDRFLFQSKTNYQEALVQLSRKLSGTIDIADVTATIMTAMKDYVRTQDVIIFLLDPKSDEYLSHGTSDGRAINFHLELTHPLVSYIKTEPGIVLKDELAFELEATKSLDRVSAIEEVTNSLTWLDAAAVLPLLVNKKLTGLIILGDKQSGEPYLQDDITFLNSFSPQAAVALENARLYQESLAFSRKLEIEVEHATHELAVANDQLRDLDKAKSEFLSIASHQLYTPLTALRGYLSMIKEGDFGRVPPKQKPVYDILEKSSARLISLIRELLDISRIESGRLELNLESIDLAAMSAALIKDLLPNAINKDLDLLFKPPTTKLPHVIGDRQRLRQVMLNFIDNAIKYTDQGEVIVTVTLDHQYLVFAVTDTGRGLEESEISKLFTKFTRVGGAAQSNTEGTGLGLYVARQIVEEMHGTVDVTSPGLGRGSTFSMHIPIEGSSNSHRLGEEAVVLIKAADSSASTTKLPV